MDPRAGGLLRPEVAAGDSTANTDGNQKQAFFLPQFYPQKGMYYFQKCKAL